MSDRNVKKRNWAFVGYPESLPGDWFESLTQLGIKGAVSPLHEFDVEADGSGQLKKPHYHIILVYNGPTSYNVVKSVTDRLNCPRPIPLEGVKGYYRYFTHKDNPEKYQYDDKDIRCFGDFDIADYGDRTASEIRRLKNSCIDFIDSHDILEYYILLKELRSADLVDELDIANTYTFYFVQVLQSRWRVTTRQKWHPNTEIVSPIPFRPLSSDEVTPVD